MRPSGFFWIALSVLLCSVAAHVLIDSVRDSGPYAEEYVLLGGTLAALGLASLFFAFTGRHSHPPRESRARRITK